MTADQGEAVIQPVWPVLGASTPYECLLPVRPKWRSRPRAVGPLHLLEGRFKTVKHTLMQLKYALAPWEVAMQSPDQRGGQYHVRIDPDGKEILDKGLRLSFAQVLCRVHCL